MLSISKTELRKKELPMQFEEEIRPDLIKRAVIAILTNRRQGYGSDVRAGKKASAKLSRRRRDYRGSYGFGISRVPRKILSRRGRRFNWVGAFAPGTVGGRKAHPPKAEKIWELKINKKERRKAIRSAIASTVIVELVKKRGHIVPKNYPFVVDNKIESLEKTSEVKKVLEKLGLIEELGRISKRKIRAGKGKKRGRKYRKIRGILIVVSRDDCSLKNAGKNIPGVEIKSVEKLNAEILAPGTNPGRLTTFTEAAIDKLAKERLFTDNPLISKEEKEEIKKVKKEQKEDVEKIKKEEKTKTVRKKAKKKETEKKTAKKKIAKKKTTKK